MTTTPAVSEALARLTQALDSPLRRTDAATIRAHIADLEARLAEVSWGRDQNFEQALELHKALEAAEAKAAASEADARRFRDLCELVQFGDLGLCIVGDDVEETKYMDGLQDIPPLLDRMAHEAEITRRVRTKHDAKKEQP